MDAQASHGEGARDRRSALLPLATQETFLAKFPYKCCQRAHDGDVPAMRRKGKPEPISIREWRVRLMKEINELRESSDATREAEQEFGILAKRKRIEAARAAAAWAKVKRPPPARRPKSPPVAANRAPEASLPASPSVQRKRWRQRGVAGPGPSTADMERYMHYIDCDLTDEVVTKLSARQMARIRSKLKHEWFQNIMLKKSVTQLTAEVCTT